jgi:hypothetical protein
MTKHDSAARGHSHTAGLLSFTIDPRTARIVKVEACDASGARHELSQDERTSLVKRRGGSTRTLEQVVERAFEAGIACVLDGETESGGADESSEDVELTHRLLLPLIEHSGAGALIERKVLDRAILDTLIEHAIVHAPAEHPGAELH